MKQTAVEWLEKQLDILDAYKIKVKTIIEYAKEMEKQQIIDAFGVGCHHESKRLVGYQDIAEQYYNKTYGRQTED